MHLFFISYTDRNYNFYPKKVCQVFTSRSEMPSPADYAIYRENSNHLQKPVN